MKKGFTFIELLIYIALLSVILNAGIYLFWQIIEGRAKSISYNEVLSNLRFIFEKISYEAKRAKSIEVPFSFGEETPKLVLKMPDERFVRFYSEEDKLMIEKEGAQPISLTSEKVKVKEIIFKNLSLNPARPQTFQVKIKLNYYNPFERIEYQIEMKSQKTINLRDNNSL